MANQKERPVVTDEQYRELAKNEFEVEGEIEIDPDATISRSEDQEGECGAYVQAWVWVRNPHDTEEL